MPSNLLGAREGGFAGDISHWMNASEGAQRRTERPMVSIRCHEEAVFQKLMRESFEEP